MNKLITLLFIFIATSSFSQALEVVSVFPINQKVNAAVDGVISVTFNSSLDLSTVAYGNFKVFGRWSGPAELSFSMSNDNKTIEMTPLEPLMNGEWITVTLSKNIKSSTGESMNHSYVWNFWTECKYVNNIQFSLIETIELREPGESLIQAYGAYAGDLNNDGYSDLTVINETSDDLRILLNDGLGNYSDFEIIPMGDSTPSPNEGADFDNDGEIDLAVCTAHGNELRVLFGDGSGTLSGTDNYSTGMFARGLGIIELDGDGNDDVVIANRQSSDMTLFLNDGFGNFSSSSFNAPGTGESGLVVTDFNNDGIQDLIIGMYTSQEIVVMLGDDNMTFTTSFQVDILGQPWMLAVGDLNNDGFADVVSANASGDNVAVLLNDGDGGFLSPTYLTESNAQFPLAIDLGDLDGDGDLDMVTTYYTSSNYLVFFNNGLGNFELSDNISLNAGTHASCAILHDRDNDGDLDITGTDEGDDILLIFDTQEEGVAANDIQNLLIQTANPNPFKDQISIELNSVCSDCTVFIYNNLGKQIKTFQINKQSLIKWDGTNNMGEEVAAGIYFLSLKNKSSYGVLKMVKHF